MNYEAVMRFYLFISFFILFVRLRCLLISNTFTSEVLLTPYQLPLYTKNKHLYKYNHRYHHHHHHLTPESQKQVILFIIIVHGFILYTHVHRLNHITSLGVYTDTYTQYTYTHIHTRHPLIILLSCLRI